MSEEQRAALSKHVPFEAEWVVLGFQIFYVHPETQSACCLRCVASLDACTCTYPSDLLELCLPQRQPQLGVTCDPAANELSVQLRIPRTRRKLSREEQQRGLTLSELRPSNWNAQLPVTAALVKAVQIRAVELAMPPDASARPPAVLSRHQLTARLVGKSYTFPFSKLEEVLSTVMEPPPAPIMATPRALKPPKPPKAPKTPKVAAAAKMPSVAPPVVSSVAALPMALPPVGAPPTSSGLLVLGLGALPTTSSLSAMGGSVLVPTMAPPRTLPLAPPPALFSNGLAAVPPAHLLPTAPLPFVAMPGPIASTSAALPPTFDADDLLSHEPFDLFPFDFDKM